MLSRLIKLNAWSWNSGLHKCVKQSVEAMLVLADGTKLYGSNAQYTDCSVCPRVTHNESGYELCDTDCKQVNHAERDAIHRAHSLGLDMKGSSMYLTGHWVCCDECRLVMKLNGIKEAILVNTGDTIINYVDFDNDAELGIMDKDYGEAMKAYNKDSLC